MTTPRSIATATLANGGGTFRADTLRPVSPDTGYAVAMVPNGDSLQCRPEPSAIRRTVRALRDRFPTAPFVGTWVDGETVYCDPVVIVPTLQDAETIGRACGQIAVWSFAESAEIRL